jgi:hypothetical protein
MVCYIIPLATGLVTAARRKALHRKDNEGFWLSLMFAGASVFGVIDHLWNGELFLIGPNIVSDLALGAVITTGVFASWGVLVRKETITQKFAFFRKTGIYQQQGA